MLSDSELAEINLNGLGALEYLRAKLDKLLQEIVILTDERDEYKRKWLEATSEGN